jgi:hypothetical protein
LWDDKARVALGMNEFVAIGDLARPTGQRATESRRSPPRLTGLMEINVLGRPLLNLGTIGGGLLASGSVGYRTEMLHFGAAVAPLGIATSQDIEGSTIPWSAYAFGSFDGRNFEAGLGLGGQSVNDTSRESEKGSGLSLVQILRNPFTIGVF